MVGSVVNSADRKVSCEVQTVVAVVESIGVARNVEHALLICLEMPKRLGDGEIGTNLVTD